MNKIKQIVIGALVVLSLSSFLIGCKTTDTTASQPEAAAAVISVEEASDAALAHANISKTDVEVKKVQIVEPDNKYVVVFEENDTTYNYEINATTGEVISYYNENSEDIILQENATPDTQTDTSLSATDSTAVSSEAVAGTDIITLEKAKEIALNHAGLAEKDVVFIKAKLDHDDGKQEYEIEFYAGNIEYDYDIEAKTGKITGYDKEIENFSIPVTNPSTTTGGITIEEAKKVALDKVPGAVDSNIRIKKDYDNGVLVYEGEIIYNNSEYDFEILASDGTITEWDVESVNH